jgi:peptidoglycan/xylan/chitin deacetylase (PgdA/CDA1 family)
VTSLTTRAFLRGGGAALTRRLHTHRAIVLRYHSVRPDDGPEPLYVSPSISLPVSLFERQIEYLARNYHPVPLSALVDAIRTGQPLLPLSVAITFDDGYLDNYQCALPILAKYRVPATIFLVSSTLTERRSLWTSRLRYALSTTHSSHLRISDPTQPETTVSVPIETVVDRNLAARTLTNLFNRLAAADRETRLEDVFERLGVTRFPPVEEWFLSAGQIRKSLASGIEFGAHTVSHPNLPGVPAEEAKREIFQSKTDLETQAGSAVRHFSYPNSGSLYPHFDASITEQVAASGYDSAVTSVDGWIDKGTDVFRFSRIGINRSWSPLARFAWHVETTRIAHTPTSTRTAA